LVAVVWLLRFNRSGLTGAACPGEFKPGFNSGAIITSGHIGGIVMYMAIPPSVLNIG